MKILITGSSSGIGLACAKLFISQGHEVLGVGRNFNKPNIPTDSRFTKTNCELRDPKERDRFFKEHHEFLKSCDVFINNAGLALGLVSFDEQTQDELTEVIETNVIAAMDFSRRMIKLMKFRKKPAQIIHMGSIAGKQAYSNGALYCASKAAIHLFNEALKRELTGTGIRVCTVAPGKVETDFSLTRFKGDKALAKKAYEGYRPLRAEDIAETVSWVVSRPDHVEISEITILATDQVDAVQVKPLI